MANSPVAISPVGRSSPHHVERKATGSQSTSSGNNLDSCSKSVCSGPRPLSGDRSSPSGNRINTVWGSSFSRRMDSRSVRKRLFLSSGGKGKAPTEANMGARSHCSIHKTNGRPSVSRTRSQSKCPSWKPWWLAYKTTGRFSGKSGLLPIHTIRLKACRRSRRMRASVARRTSEADKYVGALTPLRRGSTVLCGAHNRRPL